MPPTRDEIFELTTSAPPPSSTNDPRVSLRTPPPPTPESPDEPLPSTEDDSPEEPHTLSEYRASEGASKRLSRLRSLFDSIPIPPPSPPSSPVASTSALPAISEVDDEKRREAERRLYAKELWRKCNGAESLRVGEAASPSTGGANARSTLPSVAVRWTAFERYAEEKEKELWRLFIELDADGDMRLRKEEVREACKRAGVEVKDNLLDEFIRAVDKNNDGAISFDEWRDFLLVRYCF